jgi:transcription initiation factor IIE alpha subunit
VSQLSFDDRPGLVRNDHPDTSRQAAELVLPKSGTQRRKVYDLICRWGEATDSEIQRALGMNGNTERPRRVELVRQGLIKDSGHRIAENGREMILWVKNDG